MQTRPPTVVQVSLDAPRGSYPVLVGGGLLSRLGDLVAEHVSAHRFVVVFDERVKALYGTIVEGAFATAGIDITALTFRGGEHQKTRESWAHLTDQLIRDGVGRDGCLVAIGGGVTGDLVGFVAATYMRGLPVIQVPTSMVAMVDSAVGGKTGVDVPGGKNLVGAFHPPELVVVDPDLIETLPRRHRAEGLAEALKHGVVQDRGYFDTIEATTHTLLDGKPDITEAVVCRSIQIKASVVSEDEREGGLRKILNFGHTLGHGLEAASGYRLSHGEAVSIGMVLEARLGEMAGITEAGTAGRLAAVLEALELPVEPGPDVDAETVLSFIRMDKKARRGSARCVFVSAIGHVTRTEGWDHELPEALVRRLFEGV